MNLASRYGLRAAGTALAAAMCVALTSLTLSAQASKTLPEECVSIDSRGRLASGTPFRQPLMRGLEFRLSSDWGIGVGLPDVPSNFVWIVSPPFRTAPHLVIGAGYGVSAKESVTSLKRRELAFVLTSHHYESLTAAWKADDSFDLWQRQRQVTPTGRLTFSIADYGLIGDALSWIAFTGEACAPRI